MKINIQCIDFTSRQDLDFLVTSKVQKFTRLCADIISIEVKLRIDKSDIKENKVCAIRLVIPGNDMLANTQCKTFEEAVAEAVEALERQIEKRKTKLTDRRLI
jgi:ribosomal subunit interface protein